MLAGVTAIAITVLLVVHMLGALADVGRKDTTLRYPDYGDGRVRSGGDGAIANMRYHQDMSNGERMQQETS